MPRQSFDTSRPVRPSFTYSTMVPSAAVVAPREPGAGAPGAARCAGPVFGRALLDQSIRAGVAAPRRDAPARVASLPDGARWGPADGRGGGGGRCGRAGGVG